MMSMNIDKIKKWQKILDGQVNEMTDILERKFILVETKKMIETNLAINQDNLSVMIHICYIAETQKDAKIWFSNDTEKAFVLGIICFFESSTSLR